MPVALFREFRESDTAEVPNLFMRAIQSVYPDLQDGVWINDLRSIRDNYEGGAFIIAEVDDSIAAIGGLKRVSGSTVEMKRVAVDTDLQGIGLGQELLSVLEDKAKELGAEKIILDTTEGQAAARHLYEKNGYQLVDRKLVDHPSGRSFDTFFYEKYLS